ncbi:MAG TPA: hypothetical protein VHE30_09615 [Polyangiaceae bacterium]|nr:hypothetical protein [Polyangiaceae bacterium]
MNAARLLLVLAALSVSWFSGCASECPGTTMNGRCETKCTDAACEAVKSGAKCFSNACVLPCASVNDCLSGQKCQRARTDTGAIGSFCFGNEEIGGTDGAPCTKTAECAAAFGYACVAGACTFTCETHGDCGSRGGCTGTAKDAGGKSVRVCEKDSFPRGPGQFGTACPHGTECADCGDGGCSPASEWSCIGAGPGDVDAYCSRRFCADDTECPTGYFCATRSSGVPPCTDACGIPGDSSGDCVSPSDIGANEHYRCGPGVLFANVCQKRDFCAPCEKDVDCLGKANQVCAKDESGEKICTVRCDVGLNSCPWGSATTCGTWDPSVGPTCEHRFGSCHGTGKSCEPCVENTDCPNGFCTQTKFTGERYCVDLTLPACSCPSGTTSVCLGGGCPETPAGKPMNCYAGSGYEGQQGFGSCIGARADSNDPSSQDSCWPTR